MIKEKIVRMRILYNDISTDIDTLTKSGTIIHTDQRIQVEVV